MSPLPFGSLHSSSGTGIAMRLVRVHHTAYARFRYPSYILPIGIVIFFVRFSTIFALCNRYRCMYIQIFFWNSKNKCTLRFEVHKASSIVYCFYLFILHLFFFFFWFVKKVCFCVIIARMALLLPLDMAIKYAKGFMFALRSFECFMRANGIFLHLGI